MVTNNLRDIRLTRIGFVWYNRRRRAKGSAHNNNSKEEIKMLQWTKEVKENTGLRMEFHLQKMNEAIQILEDAGLDTVAKKLRDAHKMMVKDLNERWSPSEEDGGTTLVIMVPKDRSGKGTTMSEEDIVKELEKIAKKNSNVGRF